MFCEERMGDGDVELCVRPGRDPEQLQGAAADHEDGKNKKNKKIKIKKVEVGKPFKLPCEAPDGWPKPNIYWMIQVSSQ